MYLKTSIIKALIVVAFLIGFLLSPQLWINKRFFPIIQPVEWIPVLEAPFDFFLLFGFFGLSVLWIFCKRQIIGIAVLASLLAILIQDQMRWQPWVYLYLLMLVPYLTQSRRDENKRLILISLQLIVAGVYIWSGIHKMNTNFLNGTFALMIKASGVGSNFENWSVAGYAIPLLEFLTGLALLVPKFRKIGIYTALVIHAVILFYLSPFMLNHNSIVYPWNFAMMSFVLILFWGNKDNLLLSVLEIRSSVLVIPPVILVWLFPILNFSGYWDHNLSFSLYANKPAKFYIAIEDSETHKIDNRLENYFAKIPGLKGGQINEIDKWAYSELNVPFYPELRSFKKLSTPFCELGIDEDKVVFLALFHFNNQANFSKFTCSDLKISK